MKRILYPGQVPFGGGYRLERPDLGLVGYGTTWHSLIPTLEAWRRANGWEIGLGFYDEVEKALCEAYPAECGDESSPFYKKRTLTLTDIVRGTRVMLSQIVDRKVVPREEAERRAQICINCPNNTIYPKGCRGLCPELSEVVNWITGAQGTQYDYKLHQCGVCGCLLQAAIWVDREKQWNVLSDDQKETFIKTEPCWKKTPNENL